MTTPAFIILALGMILSAITVVHSKSLIHSALALITTFLMTAVLYIGMDSEFIAMAQIMVYVGGIVIFAVFTILLTSQVGEELLESTLHKKLIASLLSFALVAYIILKLYQIPELKTSEYQNVDGIDQIGIRLLNIQSDGFIIPFEIISLLLLAAMIGAIVIAKPKEDS